MSAFSSSNFKALNYNSFRPHYPPSFYKILFGYATRNNLAEDKLARAVDLGCGTGVATYPLLNFVDDVTGLDLSPLMIREANDLIQLSCAKLGIEDTSRIRFVQGSAEDFVKGISGKNSNNSSVQQFDLITAAQCIHWFQNFDSFFTSCASLLKKDGVLAYWFYLDPVFTDFTGDSKLGKSDTKRRAYEIYEKYIYGQEFLGPYWEQPGRNYLLNSLAEVNEAIPDKYFKDIKIHTMKPAEDGTDYSEDLNLLLNKKNASLDDYINYIKTYSSYALFVGETGDKNDIMEQFLSELETELGWDRNTTKIDILWCSGYTFMRRR